MTAATIEPRYEGHKVDLVRALPAALELRADGDSPTMFGHFAVFNRWTLIDSFFEGTFLERIAPGAFKKTFSENRDSIKVLAEHGYDPTIGKRALGTINILREDEEGGYYEVSLVDAQDVRELILPRLRQNLYGASFRFSVIREEIDEEPGTSTENPKGMPERTIKECRLFEFGPVTFPAYADASASARSSMYSMTDEVNAQAVAQGLLRSTVDPRLRSALREQLAEDGGSLELLLRAAKNMEGKVSEEERAKLEEVIQLLSPKAPVEKKEPPEEKNDKGGKDRGDTIIPVPSPKLFGLDAGREPWRL